MTIPAIDGTRIRLREPKTDDHLALFRWYNDPETVAPIDRFAVDRFRDFQEALKTAPNDPGSTAPRFLVERRDDEKLLGFVGYYRAHRVLELWDIWYVLGEVSDRGRGYGGEAVGLLVNYLFRELPLERVGATCDTENAPSYRLLERLGFLREGTLHNALFHHARWHDVFAYGLTRSSWAAKPRES